MSARAAWRLESFGFTKVYRYTAGKMDWLANGLPIEGSQIGIYRAKELAREDAPTCHPGERIGEVYSRVRATSWDVCVVANQDRIVLGLLREEVLGSDPAAAVEQVMELAPRTYRPNSPMEKIEEYLRRNQLNSVLITTPDGRLVGVLKLEGERN
jgi:hypothetical protein